MKMPRMPFGWDRFMKTTPCYVCSKEFISAPENVYIIKEYIKGTKNYRKHHCCSYTCWRKAGGGKIEEVKK
jgi:hypothetical protein